MENTKLNIQKMLKGIKIDSTLTEDTRTFVKSLTNYFFKKHYLSDKQFKCLHEIWKYQLQKEKKHESKRKTLL